MPANASKGDFFFDCIVERPRSAPFGGRFAIIVAVLLLLIALAAALPSRSAAVPAAGVPLAVQAA